jgi:phosphopentomutase
MRAFLIVLDSVGIGAAPDAAEYGDKEANTLGHLSAMAGGLKAPAMMRLGLGNIPSLILGGIPIKGIPPVATPIGSFGAMQEISRGKDTTTGHWEMAGLELPKGFHIFPPAEPSFPPHLIHPFEQRTGRRAIGNKAASGTKIIEELGEQQMKEGCWIVYTSADSVFQIAAHEEIIPLQELYRGCEIARELCNPFMVGRVIARPYLGIPGAFHRTENRRDFSFPLPEPTVLEYIQKSGITTVTVGKLDDIFVKCGISKSIHVENNADTQSAVLSIARSPHDRLFVFANLIDFDMLYGHRRDSIGYAKALENADQFLEKMIPLLHADDLMIVTADHGNDPTFKGTDHTREFVPLLVYQPGIPGRNLGIRRGFYDIAQSLAAFWGIAPMPRGVSFL